MKIISHRLLLALFSLVEAAPQWSDSGNSFLSRNSSPRGEFGIQDLSSSLGFGLLRENADQKGASRATKPLSALGLTPFSTPLKRVMLTSSRAKCNDGTPAGFYYRLASKSQTWIVFLEGGWYCFDLRSCRSRWKASGQLMTSIGWSKLRFIGGILSSDPVENPLWWKANHIYVPYCSSDCWTGTRKGKANISISSVHSLLSLGSSWHANNSTVAIEDLPFQGANILEEVLKNLAILGLKSGHSLILAGSSAGGLGVLLNIDKIHRQLSNLKLSVDVRGISDSAWFLDNEPFTPMECRDALSCAPKRAVQLGLGLWDPQIPSSCRNKFEQSPWDCYLGYKILPTIQRPMFIFQWIFDEAQMMLDNVGKPVSKQQWNYIHSIGERIILSFSSVSAVFAPSCISHAALTSSSWSGVKIGQVSVLDALQCWLKANINSHKSYIKTKEPKRPTVEIGGQSKDEVPSYILEVPGNVNAPVIEESKVKHPRIRHEKNKKNKCRKCKKKAKNQGRKRKQTQSTESYSASKDFKSIREDKVSTVKMLADSPGVELEKARENKEKNNKSNKEKRRNKERMRERRRRKRKRKRERKKERNKQRMKTKRKNKVSESLKIEPNYDNNHHRSVRASLNSSWTPKTLLSLDQEFLHESKEILPTTLTSLLVDDANNGFSEGDTCSFHLVDQCSWPHCNPSCPLLINPYTGEEMNRVQLLKSFGLSMVDLAHALGVDMPTLKAMDNKDIFLILTP